jgi:Sap, sulfolipid-1-addressing protein
VGDVVVLAFAAALNPTLVAASTVMMILPSPVKLMLGYLLGALMTSITLGLIIVFSLQDSSTVSTTKNTLSPLATIALGAIFLTLAFVVATGRWGRAIERRRVRKTRKGKEDKGPPRWQQALGKGSARVTFVVGALLTLPGASYLAGLSRIHKLNYSTADTVLVVVGFNLIMMLLLEIPLVCFVVAPKWTPEAIDRAKAWIRRHAHAFAVWMLTVLGGLLVIKGLIELLS